MISVDRIFCTVLRRRTNGKKFFRNDKLMDTVLFSLRILEIIPGFPLS